MWTASSPFAPATYSAPSVADPISRSMPASAAASPISRWYRASSGPSSFMSASTATRRPGRPARSASAARMAIGLAL